LDIRAANERDAAAVARLVVQLGYPLTPEGAQQRVINLGKDPDEALYVAVVESRVVGLIQVSRTEALEYDPRAEIRALVVDEEHRGGGVGKALVARAEAWARERGLPVMRVRSNVKREQTRIFYERHGYAVTKTQNVFDKKL